jgi:hypothetical protein
MVEAGKPLTFRSAMASPFRAQWIDGDGDELIKLVETTRTLTLVHFPTSSPTYYNRVVKEKWSPSSALLPGPSRSVRFGPTSNEVFVAPREVTVFYLLALLPPKLPLPSTVS